MREEEERQEKVIAALTLSFPIPFLVGLGVGVTGAAVTFFAFHFNVIKLGDTFKSKVKKPSYTYIDNSKNTLNASFPAFENRPQKSTGYQIPNYSLIGESWLPSLTEEGEESWD